MKKVNSKQMEALEKFHQKLDKEVWETVGGALIKDKKESFMKEKYMLAIEILAFRVGSLTLLSLVEEGMKKGRLSGDEINSYVDDLVAKANLFINKGIQEAKESMERDGLIRETEAPVSPTKANKSDRGDLH
jgi:uncharacterized Fe-S cluster-containing radical SAM superfamily enzyme